MVGGTKYQFSYISKIGYILPGICLTKRNRIWTSNNTKLSVTSFFVKINDMLSFSLLNFTSWLRHLFQELRLGKT